MTALTPLFLGVGVLIAGVLIDVEIAQTDGGLAVFDEASGVYVLAQKSQC